LYHRFRFVGCVDVILLEEMAHHQVLVQLLELLAAPAVSSVPRPW
jgi:hypothetical protein